jgi:dolichol-phosphate mannosyltransferase
VRYISNPPPSGFGFAVRRGLAEFRGEAVAIVMAVDRTTRGRRRFLPQARNGYDCVFGSRFMRGGHVTDYQA